LVLTPGQHTAKNKNGKMYHLKVSVDDGCLALVQARNSITRVTEDLQHLSLSEAGLQPLIHQIHHLSPCETISHYTASKTQSLVYN